MPVEKWSYTSLEWNNDRQNAWSYWRCCYYGGINELWVSFHLDFGGYSKKRNTDDDLKNFIISTFQEFKIIVSFSSATATVRGRPWVQSANSSQF